MTEYTLSDNREGCSYSPKKDVIYLGTSSKARNLSDSDIIKSISDSITHEILHKVLNNELNTTVSCLFDLISDNFREHMDIFKSMLNSEYERTWKQAYEEEGMNYFLNRYGNLIDNKLLDEYNIRR